MPEELSESLIVKLQTRIDNLVDQIASLIAEVPVSYSSRVGDGVIIVAPNYYWGPPTAEQRALQINIKRDYESIVGLIELMLKGAPESISKEFRQSDKQLRRWIELSSNWQLTPDPVRNESAFRKDVESLKSSLGALSVSGQGTTMAVPDTNSLLATADPVDYREALQTDRLEFLLLPTVLGELDRLKISHRESTVREKATKVITRVKGWRNQGALASGVTVDKTITVRARHNEPDMARTLAWLASDVPDDRIVASVLDVQSELPAARVVLFTSDINLLNKADAALIEAMETPHRRPTS